MDPKLLAIRSLTAWALGVAGSALATALTAPALAAPAQAAVSLAAPKGQASAPLADDRQVLKAFLAGVPVTQRRLLDDLDRTEWSPAEIRAALLKVYAVKVAPVGQFLDSPAGSTLMAQQVQGWSPWMPAAFKVYALRSAILKASRNDVLSASAVVAALPVLFQLPQTAAEARRTGLDPVCPAQCGDSVLAHLAFLVASVQVGAMGR